MEFNIGLKNDEWHISPGNEMCRIKVIRFLFQKLESPFKRWYSIEDYFCSV
jgi:hypothetical protein